MFFNRNANILGLNSGWSLWPHVPGQQVTSSVCVDEVLVPQVIPDRFLPPDSETPAHVGAGTVTRPVHLPKNFWKDIENEESLELAEFNVPVTYKSPDAKKIDSATVCELLSGVSQDADLIRELLQTYRGQSILVVDNDPINLMLCQQKLEGAFNSQGLAGEVNIVTASNFNEALDLIRRTGTPFTMAFLDYNLGDSNSGGSVLTDQKERLGSEFLPYLDGGATRAILMTANDLTHSEIPALSLYDYAFQKPLQLTAAVLAGLSLLVAKPRIA